MLSSARTDAVSAEMSRQLSQAGKALWRSLPADMGEPLDASKGGPRTAR